MARQWVLGLAQNLWSVLHCAIAKEHRMTTLNVQLVKAAAEGDVSQIEQLCALGANPLFSQSAALRAAAEHNHTEAVLALLPLSNPKAYNSFVLYSAIVNRNQILVEKLWDVCDPVSPVPLLPPEMDDCPFYDLVAYASCEWMWEKMLDFMQKNKERIEYRDMVGWLFMNKDHLSLSSPSARKVYEHVAAQFDPADLMDVLISEYSSDTALNYDFVFFVCEHTPVDPTPLFKEIISWDNLGVIAKLLSLSNCQPHFNNFSEDLKNDIAEKMAHRNDPLAFSAILSGMTSISKAVVSRLIAAPDLLDLCFEKLTIETSVMLEALCKQAAHHPQTVMKLCRANPQWEVGAVACAIAPLRNTEDVLYLLSRSNEALVQENMKHLDYPTQQYLTALMQREHPKTHVHADLHTDRARKI